MCLVTCVEFARCSRSDPTGKHLQSCNTQARFLLCWKASWYLQQDLSVSGSELRSSYENPTSRTWVPHVDGDINMGRESGFEPERDPRCSLCDRHDRTQSHRGSLVAVGPHRRCAVLRRHCPSSRSSRSWTSPQTILLMKASSFWQSGCRPRFSFVIRPPLTDGQELSIWFACLSLRQRLWHTALFTNLNDSSNKRTPSCELRFQVQGMLQKHLGWKADDFFVHC